MEGVGSIPGFRVGGGCAGSPPPVPRPPRRGCPVPLRPPRSPLPRTESPPLLLPRRRGCPARGQPFRPPRGRPGPRCPSPSRVRPVPSPPPRRGHCPPGRGYRPPPLPTPTPDRPGEICQQFATTLVITFLESAAIDVKIGSCLHFPLGIIVPVRSHLFLFPALPNHIPPFRLLRFLPLGSPKKTLRDESRCLAPVLPPCPRRHRLPSPLCVPISPTQLFPSRTRKICKACAAAEKQDKV